MSVIKKVYKTREIHSMNNLCFFGTLSIIFFSVYFVYTSYYKKTIYLVPHKLILKPINRANTAFIFDIHKVFMRQNFLEIGLRVALSRYAFILCCLSLRPSFWLMLKQIKAQSRVLEYVLYELEKIYPQLIGFSAFFEKLLLDQKPLYETVDFIKTLKKEGYALSVLSNCATETYNKMAEKYPDIFNLFNGVYLPSKENNYRSKPNPQFFNEGVISLKNYPSLMNKQLIFIDDKKKNIVAGLKEDLIGIHYISVKQLQRDVEFLRT